MTPLRLALSLAILVSAVLTIGADERGARRGVYVFKPLTTVLILCLALAGPAHDGTYRNLIAVGLVFSLAGDVFLMLPRDRFVAGLVSFLIAHVFYVAAFVEDGFGVTPWLMLVFAIYAAALLRVLWPHLGGLKGPVVVYAAALCLMAWQAAEGALDGREGMGTAAAGAALFVASDSALAVDRFARHFRRAQVVVLGTYFAAQWLIALSAHAAG